MYNDELKIQRVLKLILYIMITGGILLLGALVYLFFYLQSSLDSMWHIFPPSIAMIIYVFVVKGIANRLAKQNKRLKLLETCIDATAKIIKISDTGITVNDNPKANLILEVIKQNGTKYRCQIQHLIPRLDVSRYTEGAILKIKINESNHQDIVIEELQ